MYILFYMLMHDKKIGGFIYKMFFKNLIVFKFGHVFNFML